MMRKAILILGVLTSLIGCSPKEKMCDITHIELNEIVDISVGYSMMSLTTDIDSEDIDNFYNKINCKYKIIDEYDKNENACFFWIKTNNFSYPFYYDLGKVYFRVGYDWYVSTKLIPTLIFYWY